MTLLAMSLCTNIKWCSNSVVPKPVASAPPGNLLKMHVQGPHPTSVHGLNLQFPIEY